MLRLNQIRDFLAVLDCGSVRSAALRLGVSQPAVSKSVRSLETELGVELLRRSTSGVTATAAGAAFAARARVVQLELARARDDIDAARGAGETALHIGMGSAPMALLGTQPIVQLLAAHPDSRMHIIEGPGQTLLPLVRDGTIDLAVVQRVEPAAAPGLRYRPLIRIRLVVVGRKGHPLARARSLSELRDARWLVYRPPRSHGVLELALRAEGLPFPANYVQCESFALTMALLRDSDLLGLIVPEAVASQQCTGLQQINLARPLPEISIGVYRRADAPTSSIDKELWGYLLQAAREHSSRR